MDVLLTGPLAILLSGLMMAIGTGLIFNEANEIPDDGKNLANIRDRLKGNMDSVTYLNLHGNRKSGERK